MSSDAARAWDSLWHSFLFYHDNDEFDHFRGFRLSVPEGEFVKSVIDLDRARPVKMG